MSCPQAVAGATYVLRRGVDAILLEHDGDVTRVRGVRTETGQELRCTALACGAAYWAAAGPAPPPASSSAHAVHRAALLIDAPLMPDRQQLLAVVPPGSLHGGGPASAVRVLQYGPSACVTPEGRYLLYFSTRADGRDDVAAQAALWPTVTSLVDTSDAAAPADAPADDGAARKPRLRWAVFYTQTTDDVAVRLRITLHLHARSGTYAHNI